MDPHDARVGALRDGVADRISAHRVVHRESYPVGTDRGREAQRAVQHEMGGEPQEQPILAARGLALASVYDDLAARFRRQSADLGGERKACTAAPGQRDAIEHAHQSG